MKVKKEMPESLKVKMHNYRVEGCWKVPQEYIDFHRNLADLVVIKLKGIGCKIENIEMKSDGHGDQMKVLSADLTYQDISKKIHWMPDNQEFFEESPSGGAFPLRLEVRASDVV